MVDGQEPQPQNRSISPKVVVGIVLAVLALVFVFQNTNKSEFNLFFWDFSAPKWLWLIILFGLGVVVGSIFPWFRRRRDD